MEGMVQNKAISSKFSGERAISDNSFIFNQHLERYKFALSYVKSKVVLDVACGTGYGVDLLLNQGKAKKVFGVDVDSSTIKLCNEHYNGFLKLENVKIFNFLIIFLILLFLLRL